MATKEAGTTAQQQRRLLVVDDEGDKRRALAEFLEREGYSVVAVASIA